MTTIQVLTFTISDRFDGERGKLARRVDLALAEFDGLLADHWDALPDGQLVGELAWRDEAAMETFRHSELYARLMVCVYLEDGQDRSFAAGMEAPTLEEMAWLAAA